MGRWCQVDCNCSDRRPIDDFGNYACGHRYGAAYGRSAHVFFGLAQALETAFRDARTRFEITLKAGYLDGCDYDKPLALTSEERDLWRLEVVELQEFLSGKNYMGWEEQRDWDAYWRAWSEHTPGADAYPDAILREVLSCCEASERTGNRIVFTI